MSRIDSRDPVSSSQGVFFAEGRVRVDPTLLYTRINDWVKMGSNTRAALLEHGLMTAKEKGLRGVIVREVARSAGVNVGSFVYHFGSRDEFLSELVQDWYEPLAQKLEISALDPSKGAVHQLEAVLIAQARLIASESMLIAHLVMDAAAGETAAREFLLKVPARHPRMIIGLIERAQRDGDLVPGHPAHLGQFLVGSVWYPMLVIDGIMRDRDWIPSGLDELIALVRDPEAAVERIGWALAGLRATRPAGGDRAPSADSMY